MSEDRATQRCDPSAGMEVSGEGDAACVTLFYVSANLPQHHSLTETPKR